jgi:hypothetical protein
MIILVTLSISLGSGLGILPIPFMTTVTHLDIANGMVRVIGYYTPVMLDSNLATATTLLPIFANAFGGAVFVC